MVRMRLIVFFCFLFLAACQPSAEDIEKAISQTQTAQPTSTTIPTSTPIPSPTPIALQDIDLSEIVFLPGDLPAGYEPAQIRTIELEQLGDYAADSINMFKQDISFKNDDGGSVSIYLFETPEKALNAFDLLIKENISEFAQYENLNIGDKSLGVNMWVPLIGGLDPIEMSEAIFVHCNALALTHFNLSSSYRSLVDYAKRLDERLSDIACP